MERVEELEQNNYSQPKPIFHRVDTSDYSDTTPVNTNNKEVRNKWKNIGGILVRLHQYLKGQRHLLPTVPLKIIGYIF